MNKFVLFAAVSMAALFGWASAGTVLEDCEEEIQKLTSMAMAIDDEFTPECAKKQREEFWPENYELDTILQKMNEVESRREEKEMRECRRETHHSYDHMPKDRREDYINQVKDMEVTEACQKKMEEIYDYMKTAIGI